MLLLVLLALACCGGRAAIPGGGVQRPPFAVGDLRMPSASKGAAAGVQEAAAGTLADCAAAAVADLAARRALPQWPPDWAPRSFDDKRLGPFLSLYPAVAQDAVPAGCDRRAWAWERLRGAIALTISMRLNYCHFRSPAWEAPPEVRAVCVTPAGRGPSSPHPPRAASQPLIRGVHGHGRIEGGAQQQQPPCVWMMTSVCNEEGFASAAHPWRGLDCQNFVAWCYNLAFGYYPSTLVAEAACHPTRAPGRLLHDISVATLHRLQPGDLVFGTLRRRPHAAPSPVRHVALWTGWTVDFEATDGPLSNATLLAALPEPHRPACVRSMAAQLAARGVVHVIADSSWAGPALRPLCGAYLNFSHARRIIEPDAARWPHKNARHVAAWDAASGTCVSTWALAGSEAALSAATRLTHATQRQHHQHHHHRPT